MSNQPPLDPPSPQPPGDHPSHHQHVGADITNPQAGSPEDIHEESTFDNMNHEEQAMAKSSVARRVNGPVAPFLSRHIPDQYAPRGLLDLSQTQDNKDLNTRFNYRHRSALQCRRPADEPAMEQLQKELESLPLADQQTIAHVWSVFSAAPNKHRNLIMRGILMQCCLPELSTISSAVAELLRIDYLSTLPTEIALRIVGFLDTASLGKAAQVSRQWRMLADDDEVWHRMCQQHIDRKCTKCGWGMPSAECGPVANPGRPTKQSESRKITGANVAGDDDNAGPSEHSSDAAHDAINPNVGEVGIEAGSSEVNKNGKRKADEEHAGHDANGVKRLRTDGQSSLSVAPRRTWKEIYRERYRIGQNWKHGRFSLKTFKGHTDAVMCLQFNDEILATGSYDRSIKIWDIASGRLLRTLRGHQLGIRALQFDEDRLISGSMDCSVRIWNWRTGECVSRSVQHTHYVVGLHFEGHILATGSADHTIRIWNLQKMTTYALEGHEEWVNSVKLQSQCRRLLSASDDLTIRLWDLKDRTCLKVFDGFHTGQIQQVFTLPLNYTYEAEDDPTGSGNSPAASHSFESDSGQTPSGATEEVESVGTDLGEAAESWGMAAGYGRSDENDNDRELVDARYMVTASLDSTLRLWDIKTGQCLRTFFGHLEGVWGVAADTVRVVSAAHDRSVKIWDARSGRCERTFTGHTGPVTCIALSDRRLCSGSEDNDVRMYDFS
ncbi:MAG: hypothetical protein M1823_005786 [Watsoniomyces obsoletus]|nr:MAG: hypothetical protein M1823_005786 [Watsoniomyces obsoletus]